MKAVRLAIAACVLAVEAEFAHAQFLDGRPEIWDIELGSDVAEIPRLDYQDYACGTNGGPPALPLSSFAEFDRCRPDHNGLYEVQFRYDDEQEYIARAYEAEALIERLQGTRPFGTPAIISVLVDADGIVEGLRVVTDDRVSDSQREAAYTFAIPFRARFGPEGWDCEQTPPGDDRRPVGNAFADDRCTKATDGLNLVVESHFYRRPGQFAIDPVSGRPTSGEFISTARIDIFRHPYWP